MSDDLTTRAHVQIPPDQQYELFLQSDFWKNLSLQKKKDCNFRCQRCGSEKSLNAHHIRYRASWWNTRLEDLLCLCRRCHEIAHGIHKPPHGYKPWAALPTRARSIPRPKRRRNIPPTTGIKGKRNLIRNLFKKAGRGDKNALRQINNIHSIRADA